MQSPGHAGISLPFSYAQLPVGHPRFICQLWSAMDTTRGNVVAEEQNKQDKLATKRFNRPRHAMLFQKPFKL